MRKKIMIATLIFMCALGACIVSPQSASAAAGAISSVSNTTDGIKVKWTKDATKDGYYIYRITGTTGGYSKVKTIKGNSTLSWTDTNVTNGSRYVYKVIAYKGSKKASTTTSKTIYRLRRPVIQSLSKQDVGDFKVKSDENLKASGYVVYYSRYSSFSSKSSVVVAGSKSINKLVNGLTPGKKYYVKIKSYKTVSGTKYYSTYSKVKYITTKNTYTAFTKELHTSLYTKPSSSASKISVNYNEMVTICESTKVTSTGDWVKVIYNGKTYYTWIAKGTSKFSDTPNLFSYATDSMTKYQKEVVEACVAWYQKGNTEYKHNQSTGTLNENGKYGFDCSGLVSYIINGVMEKYVPVYRLNSGIGAIGKTDVIFNGGYSSEFKAKKVCGSTLDLSKLKPGDLVFFNHPDIEQHDFPWNHVGIYLGNGDFCHIAPLYNKIMIMPLVDAYEEDFVMATRVLPTSVTPINAKGTVSDRMSVYPNWRCVLETRLVQFKDKEEITLLWTSPRTDGKITGYIKYDTDKYGFTLNPADHMTN